MIVDIIAINQVYLIKHSFRHAKAVLRSFRIKSRNYCIYKHHKSWKWHLHRPRHRITIKSHQSVVSSAITISLFTYVRPIITLIQQRCLLITADSVWFFATHILMYHRSNDQSARGARKWLRILSGFLTNEPSRSLLEMKCQCGIRWILIPVLNRPFRI